MSKEERWIPIIPMEDELVHTDDHPFCDDKMCFCHSDFEAVWLLTTQHSTGLMTKDETLRLYRGENV